MPRAYSSVCYYVVAHQDDWQLFYGQQAFSDLAEPGSRVVFLYTTAGDAGASEDWWRARERGALAAQALPGGLDAPKNPSAIRINDHEIAVYDSGSVVSYHMRLPDGNVPGNGFAATGHVSLERLQIGCISQMAAIDQSTIYTSWGDFCATVGAIIDREGPVDDVWVNAADWSWNCSPEDHSDHKATANALRKVFCDRGNRYDRLWFTTYSTKHRSANLRGEALQRKEAVWSAYKQQVEALADLALLRWEWEAWGAKNYYRRVPAGEDDSGSC